jgi:hypothetical protein
MCKGFIGLRQDPNINHFPFAAFAPFARNPLGRPVSTLQRATQSLLARRAGFIGYFVRPHIAKPTQGGETLKSRGYKSFN